MSDSRLVEGHGVKPLPTLAKRGVNEAEDRLREDAEYAVEMARQLAKSSGRGNEHEVCVYCGETSTSIDHVIPFSYRPNALMKRRFTKLEGPLVPACGVCNGALGNYLFLNFYSRLMYIRGRLAKKARRRRYNRSTWSKGDVAELGRQLQAQIRKREAEGDYHARRFEFCEAMIAIIKPRRAP